MERLDHSLNTQNQPVNKGTNKKLPIIILVALLTIGLVILFITTRVKSIRVINNNIISDEYIKEVINIKKGDLYFLVFPSVKETQAKKNPYLNSVKISFSKGNSVLIDVDDKAIIGYTNLLEGDNYVTYFVFKDGSLMPFDASVIKNLAILPYFSNVSKEYIELIAIQLAKLDYEIISRISDVNMVAFTYDANMVELISIDGYRIYSSIKGLPYCKDYLEIILYDSSDNNKCMLIMEEYSKALLLKCSEIKQYLVKE